MKRSYNDAFEKEPSDAPRTPTRLTTPTDFQNMESGSLILGHTPPARQAAPVTPEGNRIVATPGILVHHQHHSAPWLPILDLSEIDQSAASRNLFGTTFSGSTFTVDTEATVGVAAPGYTTPPLPSDRVIRIPDAPIAGGNDDYDTGSTSSAADSLLGESSESDNEDRAQDNAILAAIFSGRKVVAVAAPAPVAAPVAVVAAPIAVAAPVAAPRAEQDQEVNKENEGTWVYDDAWARRLRISGENSENLEDSGI